MSYWHSFFMARFLLRFCIQISFLAFGAILQHFAGTKMHLSMHNTFKPQQKKIFQKTLEIANRPGKDLPLLAHMPFMPCHCRLIEFY
jgi:hypothetical protein